MLFAPKKVPEMFRKKITIGINRNVFYRQLFEKYGLEENNYTKITSVSLHITYICYDLFLEMLFQRQLF